MQSLPEGEETGSQGTVHAGEVNLIPRVMCVHMQQRCTERICPSRRFLFGRHLLRRAGSRPHSTRIRYIQTHYLVVRATVLKDSRLVENMSRSR